MKALGLFLIPTLSVVTVHTVFAADDDEYKEGQRGFVDTKRTSKRTGKEKRR